MPNFGLDAIALVLEIENKIPPSWDVTLNAYMNGGVLIWLTWKGHHYALIPNGYVYQLSIELERKYPDVYRAVCAAYEQILYITNQMIQGGL